MTDQMKLSIEVGMRVMVKVASREIPATVIEVREDCFIVKSETSGKQFRTSRVVDILDQPEPAEAPAAEEAPAEEPAEAPAAEEADIAGAAAEIADEEKATAELLKRQEETAANPPPFEMPGEPAAPEAEDAPEAEPSTVSEDAEGDSQGDSPEADGGEPPAGEAPETPEAPAAKPKKNLSLVEAAVEVLKAEKKPMNVKELVKLAVERGLWIPTKCKTPEQSLYGGLYLEMKNSAKPRVKKSAEKGKFELA